MKIAIDPRDVRRRVRKGSHRNVRETVAHRPKVIYNRKNKYSKRDLLESVEDYFEFYR